MNRRLPTWLADWIGVSPAAGTESATWQLDSAWTWPPWATVLLILAVILVTVILYARESSGAGRAYRTLLVALRLVAIAVVLVMLAQWALALRITGPPSIAIVIDRSASMGIADRYGETELPAALRERLVASGLSEPTRLNLAKFLLTGDEGKLLHELAARNRVEVYLAAAGVERIPHSNDAADVLRTVRELSTDGPERGSTRLGDAVRRILDDFRGAAPAAIVLLTDGVNTAGVPLADAALEARRKGVPLMTVGLGSARPPRDIEIADVLVDETVFVADPVSLQVQVKASGLEGEPAMLTLRREGESAALAEQVVRLPSTGQTLSLQLVDRPIEPGEIQYVVEIAPRDDEVNTRNNRQRRTVAVRDEKIKVLLVYGYPNYEFRFLKTLLERDSTVELATYLQDADPEYAEQDKTALGNFPVNRDALFDYDVLLLGDVDPRLLPRSTWPSLRAFVGEKGGGVALLAGPRYLPWLYQDNADVRALLPVVPNSAPAAENKLPGELSAGFKVRPTPLGLQAAALQLGEAPSNSQQIWSSLAPLYWLYEVGDLKPAAQVFAQAAARDWSSDLRPLPSAFPIICFQYFGPGRVLFHAVDSTWRWRLGAGDVYFARYWVQAVRFLARSKLASGRGAQLSTDRREYRQGEAVQIKARFLDPRLAPAANEVTIAIDSAGEPRRRVALRRNPAVENVFDASLADLPEGHYEMLLVEPRPTGRPPSARFSVAAQPGEFARQEMDAPALSAVAQLTRGTFYTFAEADRQLADLPAGRRVPVENLPPIPIWNRWWLLATFLLALTTEWILRKRKGML